MVSQREVGFRRVRGGRKGEAKRGGLPEDIGRKEGRGKERRAPVHATDQALAACTPRDAAVAYL